MKNKFLTIMILIIMFINVFIQELYAVKELREGGKKEEENLKENSIIFDNLLSEVINYDLESKQYKEFKKTLRNGVWIEENTREYFLNLINKVSNNRYEINNEGYLKISNNLEINNDDNSKYIEKIDNMINNKKTIIVTVKSKNIEQNLNNKNLIKENEYAMFYNEILILNEKKYNKNVKEDQEILVDKFLEVYENNERETSNNIKDTDETKEEQDLQENKTIDNDITNIEIEDNKISNNIESLPKSEEISKDNIFDDRVTEEQFNVILSGMIEKDKKEIDDINNIIKSEINDRNGIWIDKQSRVDVIDFINKYTIYTYSVNSNGFLKSDNIMKDNPNLDQIKKSETEMDKELKNIMSSEIFIAIGIKKSYNYIKNNDIVEVKLADSEFKKTFSNKNNRIIILNDMYYLNDEYDLGLSDYFIKSLNNVEEKVIKGELTFFKNDTITTFSDTSKPGIMYSAQNVYCGPNSENYAKVGSVSKGEQVYLLGQSIGWYHIQYVVTGSSTQKSGFVPVDAVNENGNYVHEEILTGGQRYTNHGIAVQSCDDFDISTQIGSIYEGEGVTLIYSYGYSDAKKEYNVAFVEFSTSSGTKRGYMYTDQLVSPSYVTSVARVIKTNSAYSGTDADFVKLGGVYVDEYVSILAKNGNWVLVEYNTTSGRKRGYMLYSKLKNCNEPSSDYINLPSASGLFKANKQLTVYGGPNENYAKLGIIYSQEVVTLYKKEKGFAYVEYTTSNGAKKGYVISSDISETSAPSIPNISVPSKFTSGTYGTSGLGKDLKYYKMGSGKNVAFIIFEQHGWEDAWASDGIELVKIAKDLINNLNSYTFSDWTIYVIPYANPDGITNGYSNNGPGRCTVSSKIDMNRSWPEDFTPFYTSRNYTGKNYLGSKEGQQLKAFLEKNDNQSATTLLLDVHGWLNKTYGDSEIGTYYNQQFNNTHRSAYGAGYLETWGNYMGYKSCLVELPMPSSASDIINKDFSGKFSTATINMLKNISKLGEGTIVNENVKITSTGNVNIRKSPTTSSAIVASLSNGTTLTRVAKGVVTANGYTWDKIILNDGTEGYIATNFLTIISESNNYIKYSYNNDLKAVKAYLRYNNLFFTGVTDNYYGNDLIDAIEEYQKVKGLTINGELNTDTLSKMGFSCNTSGIISKNDFYKNYLGIANNYLYDIEYLVQTIGSDGVPNITTFLFGEGKSKSDDAYVEKKKSENSKYNSVTYSSNRKKELEKVKTTLREIAYDYEYVYPQASQALYNYVFNTGETLTLNINSLFNIDTMNSFKKKCIERCMIASEHYVSGNITIGKFAKDYEYDVSVNLGSAGTTNVDRQNWFLAAHAFKLGNDVTLNKSGDNYTMKLNFRFKDYYDWDDDENDTYVFPLYESWIIHESDIKALHYAGMCRNYETVGNYTLTVKWSRGQSVNNATITVN